MEGSATPSSRAAYAAWRATRLGSAVERVESDLVFQLAGHLEGCAVLDVGCGDGTYAIGAARRGALAVGIDHDADMVSAARERAAAERARVTWRLADAGALPFEDNTFDVVVAVTVLGLAEDPASILVEVGRVLKPGGRVIVGELNRWSPWALWRRVRTWLGRADWSRVRFWAEDDLRRLLRTAGLQPGRVRGAVWFPPVESWATVLSRWDSRIGAVTHKGAAFLALAAHKVAGARTRAEHPPGAR